MRAWKHDAWIYFNSNEPNESVMLNTLIIIAVAVMKVQSESARE